MYVTDFQRVRQGMYLPLVILLLTKNRYVEAYLRDKGVTIIVNERIVISSTETGANRYSTTNGIQFTPDMV